MNVSYELKKKRQAIDRASQGINEISMANRVKDYKKAFLNMHQKKENPRSGLGPLVDADDRILNSDVEKAEISNRYFCSVFEAGGYTLPTYCECNRKFTICNKGG